MRLLANENLPGPVVAALRKLGHDVDWIKESMPGAGDSAILALAQREDRVVVTCDTDFGELAFRSRLPAESGVVLIRLEWIDPDADNQVGLAGGTAKLTALQSWQPEVSYWVSFWGSIKELREVMDMAEDGRLTPIPLEFEPLERVNDVYHRLEQGKIKGRAVITP